MSGGASHSIKLLLQDQSNLIVTPEELEASTNEVVVASHQDDDMLGGGEVERGGLHDDAQPEGCVDVQYTKQAADQNGALK